MRRPLQLIRTYPREAVVRSVRRQARTPAAFGGAKELVTRVRLTATDADLSVGEGPDVRRPALSLLLALCGRPVGVADLSGPGVPVLA